ARCDERRRGIEAFQLRRFIRPAKRGNWPQGGREPSVEDIRFLNKSPITFEHFKYFFIARITVIRIRSAYIKVRGVKHRTLIQDSFKINTILQRKFWIRWLYRKTTIVFVGSQGATETSESRCVCRSQFADSF